MKLMRIGELLAPNVSVHDVIFPLVSLIPEPQFVGTCFSVSSCGIYATAAHIFEPFQEVTPERRKPEISQKPLTYNSDELQVGIFRIKEDKNGFVGKLFPVDGLTIFFDQDIAFLIITDEHTSRFGFSHPSAIPIMELPKVGMPVRIIGCPKEGHFENETKIGFAFVESVGVITEKHPEKRDNGFYWFPCFETNASMGPGHSGGPVLNTSNYSVMGINSGSLGSDYSVISWIGKALDLEFSIPGLNITTLKGDKIPFQSISLRKLENHGLTTIV